MTSIHQRRLASRVAHTAGRFTDLAATQPLSVADLTAVKLPWYEVRDQAADAGPATVFIFDEIGGSFGIDAADFVDEIEAITAPTIHLRINSPGGSVFDAIAIYNALNHHPARVVAYVDSLAASAASVIAMAGDEVVMMPGSQMMIHDASALEDGNAADMTKMATWLDRQSQNIADLYQLRGGKDAGYWRELMRAETWMFAQEAVDLGLADRVEQVQRRDPEVEPLMTRSFDLSRYRYAGRREAPEPGTRRSAAPAAPALVRTRANGDFAGAAQQRARALTVSGGQRCLPIGNARSVPFASQLRAQLVQRDGREVYHIHGTASAYGQLYEMWDEHGPYKEGVRPGAGALSLAASPDVAFLVNHRGITMARTTSGSLVLTELPTGLSYDAYVNPKRQDVRDLVVAIDDGDITESSFAFLIVQGQWNRDFTEFWIEQYDLHRGDASAVNYGANPYTDVAARSREIMRDLDHLPAGAARAALDRLQHRDDLAPVTAPPVPAAEATGRSITALDAWLAVAKTGR